MTSRRPPPRDPFGETVIEFKPPTASVNNALEKASKDWRKQAFIFMDLSNYDQAMIYFLKAMEACTNKSVENLNTLCSCLCGIATINEQKSLYGNAEWLYSQVLDIEARISGRCHPAYIACLGYLARTLSAQSQDPHSDRKSCQIAFVKEMLIGHVLSDLKKDWKRVKMKKPEKIQAPPMQIADVRSLINTIRSLDNNPPEVGDVQLFEGIVHAVNIIQKCFRRHFERKTRQKWFVSHDELLRQSRESGAAAKRRNKAQEWLLEEEDQDEVQRKEFVSEIMSLTGELASKHEQFNRKKVGLVRDVREFHKDVSPKKYQLSATSHWKNLDAKLLTFDPKTRDSAPSSLAGLISIVKAQDRLELPQYEKHDIPTDTAKQFHLNS